MLNRKLCARRSASLLTSAAALAAAGMLLAGCASGPSAGSAAGDVAAEPTSTITASTPAATPAETASAHTGTEVPVTINSALLDPSAGTIEVRGTVTEFIGDGTCTATAVNADGTTLSAQLAATPDAQSTICAPVIISGATAGDWNVTLSFTAEGVWGESESLAAQEN